MPRPKYGRLLAKLPRLGAIETTSLRAHKCTAKLPLGLRLQANPGILKDLCLRHVKSTQSVFFSVSHCFVVVWSDASGDFMIARANGV